MNLVDKFLIVDSGGSRYLIRWRPDGGEWQHYAYATDYKDAVRKLQEAGRTLPQPCTIECYGFVAHGRVMDGRVRFETCYGPVEEAVPEVNPS